CPVAAPRSRLLRSFGVQIRPRPTSSYTPSLPADPWLPTESRATARDIFRQQSLRLLSWPAPALALPSVSPRTSAPGRISSAVPNTSASAPATTPFLSAPVPLVLSRSQTPNLPRSSAQHSPGSFAARTSASPAFPFQTSSVTSRDQKSTKAPQSS